MSTEPEGWAAPKTDWIPDDTVGHSDLNRWEGNSGAIETGERTLDPAQAPSSNKGSLRQILDWLANRIKAITGATNWYDAPATTLAAAKSHIDTNITSSTTAHGIKQGADNGLDADKLDGKHWVVRRDLSTSLSANNSGLMPTGAASEASLLLISLSSPDVTVYAHQYTAVSGAARWTLHTDAPNNSVSINVWNDSSSAITIRLRVLEWV
jgi:hypothetical protein